MSARSWRRFVVGVLTMFCCLNASAANQANDFKPANDEFAAGHFREAIAGYEAVVGSGAISANVFYNLGNAWYRSGDYGRAILNYERALALDPQHPEAQANLRLARDKAHALELRRTPWERAASWTTVSNVSAFAAAAFWIAAFALTIRLLARRRSRIALAVFCIATAAFAAALAALYVVETGSKGAGLAIVVADKIEARLATADNAGTVLTLPPGSEVKILSTRGDWMYAALPNEQRGWIPAPAAERVRL